MKLDLGISIIEKNLMKKEEEFDHVMAKQREIVRLCSNTIKALHGKSMDDAKKYLSDAKKELAELKKLKGFDSQFNHILQEFVEAQVVFSAVENGTIPSFEDLGVHEGPYLTGLLDSVGELKREMYEALRHKDRKKAEHYFELMDAIYDALLPLRFSNAVLPEFRRKQDVARIQIEQARGELL